MAAPFEAWVVVDNDPSQVPEAVGSRDLVSSTETTDLRLKSQSTGVQSNSLEFGKHNSIDTFKSGRSSGTQRSEKRSISAPGGSITIQPEMLRQTSLGFQSDTNRHSDQSSTDRSGVHRSNNTVTAKGDQAGVRGIVAKWIVPRFGNTKLETDFARESASMNHFRLRFAVIPVVLAFAIAHTGGVGDEEPPLAYLSFGAEGIALLILLVYACCQKAKVLMSEGPTGLCVMMLWYCSLNLSFGSSGQRHQLLGSSDSDEHVCDDGFRTLSVALLLAYGALFVRWPVVVFLGVSQAVCFQHLLIGIVLPVPGCPWSSPVVSGLQLHVLAFLLALAQRKLDAGCRLTFLLRQYQKTQEDKPIRVKEVVQSQTERAVWELKHIENGLGLLHDEVACLPHVPSSVAAVLWGTHQSIRDSVLCLQQNRRESALHDLRQQIASSTTIHRKRTKSKTLGGDSESSQPIQEYLEMVFTPHNLSAQALQRPASEKGPTSGDTSTGLATISSQESLTSRKKSRRSMKSFQTYHGDSNGGTGSSWGDDAHTEPLSPLSLADSPKMLRMLNVEFNLGEWHCKTLELEEDVGHALQVVGLHLLNSLGCLQKQKLREFLKKLEESYHANPYHSHVHGADMCNSFFYLLRTSNLWRAHGFVESQRAAVLVAALGHDVGHPGRSNQFLVATQHAWALTYNDSSVAENYHASTTWKMFTARDEDGSLVQGWSASDLVAARSLLVPLILATDMQHHFESLSAFRVRLGSGSFHPFNDPKDEMETLKLLFHAADLGHSAKPWASHYHWSERVTEEFFLQGDEEAQLGLPISPLCSRKNSNLASSQVGFLQFVCVPMWREIQHLEEFSKKQMQNQARQSTSQGLETSATSRPNKEGVVVPDISSRPLHDNVVSQCDENLKQWKEQMPLEDSTTPQESSKTDSR